MADHVRIIYICYYIDCCESYLLKYCFPLPVKLKFELKTLDHIYSKIRSAMIVQFIYVSAVVSRISDTVHLYRDFCS